MSLPADQLGALYKQLQEYCIATPLISVVPTKGDPPEQFEIIYKIEGITKTDNGEIVQSAEHIVELAIPFGFPHFPPSCKPKSNIFHPDFDSAAICIGDFWNHDKHIIEVIVYIGKLINGEFYSKTNTFNEEAAEWYKDHSDQFPLSTISWQTYSEEKSKRDDAEVDTISEDDLNAYPDFLSLEESQIKDEITLDTSFPEVQAPTQSPIDRLYLLDSKKQFFTLLSTESSIDESSSEIDELLEKARERVHQAKSIHRKAKELEKKGDAQDALELFKNIPDIISDFPALQSDIHRVSQTLILLEDILDPIDALEEDVEEKPKAIKKDKTKKKTETLKTTTSKSKEDISKTGKSKSFLPIISVTLLLLVTIIGVGGFFYYSFQNKLAQSEQAFTSCTTLIKQQSFQDAKRSCDKALQLVRRVKFIEKNRADKLKGKIEQTLRLKTLTEGLAGKILYEGRYLPKEDVVALKKFTKSYNKAETHYSKKEWQQAAELLKELEEIGEKTGGISTKALLQIKKKRVHADFRVVFDKIQKEIEEQQYQNGLSLIQNAKKLLKDFPEGEQVSYKQQIDTAFQICHFKSLKQQGDTSFSKGSWDSAIESYSSALKSQYASVNFKKDQLDIEKKLVRAKVYTTIKKGNESFSKGSWDKAIQDYTTASKLLNEGKGLLGEVELTQSREKIKKIVLLASIIRDKKKAEKQLDAKNLSQASKLYNQILRTIKTSSYTTDEKFVTTSNEIQTTLETLNNKIFLQEKEAYLFDNYKQLFNSNYPTANPIDLQKPIIKFKGEEDNKLIFRMQCTEMGRGRPLNLVMYYSYDKNTREWQLYTN